MLLLGAQQTMAAGFVYECSSSGNRPLFDTGDSSNLTIEVNSDHLSIDNGSGTWIHLGFESTNEDYVFYSRLTSDSDLQTADFEATVQQGITKGKPNGQLDLRKFNTEHEQHYSCTLSSKKMN